MHGVARIADHAARDTVVQPRHAEPEQKQADNTSVILFIVPGNAGTRQHGAKYHPPTTCTKPYLIPSTSRHHRSDSP